MRTEPLNVIIVEDEALLALELEALVEEAGHRVVGWATCSSEACELIDTVEADLALVDVQLSDGPTGVDVARHAIEVRNGAVVFTTANPKRIPDGYAGALGVISKPYTMHGLIDALGYLQEAMSSPPPSRRRPVGLTLAPGYEAAWSPA